MNKTYSVTLSLETAIKTSVVAKNEEEAEQIAIDNFYNQNIEEVQELAESEFLRDFLYHSTYLSENDDAVYVEEEA